MKQAVDIGVAILEAAEQLPANWNLKLDIERGSANVTLENESFEEVDVSDTGDGLASVIREAISIAKTVATREIK